MPKAPYNHMTHVICCNVGSGPYPGTDRAFMPREEYLARLAIMRAEMPVFAGIIRDGSTEDGMALYTGFRL